VSGRRKVVVLDYGAGNVASVVKALQHEGSDAILSSDPEAARRADLLVLPGQGHFGQCMNSLVGSGLATAIHDFVGAGRPFLGICVGMQLLYEGSEEAAGVAGLGLLPGLVRRIPTKLHLPHVGWNAVSFTCAGINDPLLAGVASAEPRYFYHVHTFAQLEHEDPSVLGVCTYDVPFATIVGRDNVRGVQFHPEKSQEHGLAILRNFARL
jgi:glutamine amidotransferase